MMPYVGFSIAPGYGQGLIVTRLRAARKDADLDLVASYRLPLIPLLDDGPLPAQEREAGQQPAGRIFFISSPS